MKVVLAISLLFCFLGIAESKDLVCNDERDIATITISSDSENNVWAAGVSDIQLKVNISCPRNLSNDVYSFSLLENGALVNSNYIANISLNNQYFSTYKEKSKYGWSLNSNKFNDMLSEVTVDIYILYIYPSSLTLEIKNNHSNRVFCSQSFVFKNCKTSAIPSELFPTGSNGRSFMHEDIVNTTCSDGLLFVEDKYQTAMNITCGRYAQWEITKYNCTPGCLTSQLPDQLVLNSKLDQPYVLSGEMFNVTCNNSLLFVSKIYHANINAICRRDSTWITSTYECATGCSTSQPPSSLRFITVFNVAYVYRSYTAVVSCSSLFLFVHGSYKSSAYATCGQTSTWETPAYECAVGCPYLSSPFKAISGQQIASRYRVGTVLEVDCRYGRLYINGTQTSFKINSPITCQNTGEWNMGSIGCWEDQIVNFTAAKQTLHSNKLTVFAFESTSTSLEVRITVGETVFQSKLSAWGVITMTSKLNQVTAFREVINTAGVVVSNFSTILNVQYSPEILDKDLRFGLQNDRSGRVTIEFMSNPTLSLSYIRVMKNKSEIQNYYLTRKEFTHRVIVDFPTVQNSDFGDYVITVTSYSPVRNTLEANFTIFQSEPASEPLTAAHGAVIAIGVIVGIALVAVAVFMGGRRVFKEYRKSESIETDGTPDTVTYHAEEHHKYENIDDKPDVDDDEFDNDSDNNDGNVNNKGYENVQFTETTPHYENADLRLNMGAASKPPIGRGRGVALKLPTNGEKEVALKPATGRGRGVPMKPPVASKPQGKGGAALKPSTGKGNPAQSENPYMVPTMPGWR